MKVQNIWTFEKHGVSLIYQKQQIMLPAHIILEQLGGRKFIAMTGSKNFFHDNDGRTLGMHLTPNIAGAKYLQITLDASDTYTMVFSTSYKNTLIEIAKYEDVYCDMLQEVFTEVTGLYTSLGTMRG